MKKRYWLSLVIVLEISIIFSTSCKKDINDIIPEVRTAEVTMVTPVSASCSGIVTSDGSSGIVEKGVCWGEFQFPSVSDNKAGETPFSSSNSFISNLTSLKSNTTYFVRAYAINNTGTAYGNELTFTTPVDHSGEEGIVSDIEGNVYQTIGIGSQIWTSENLKTTKYNDGTPVPFASCARIWSALISPGYCWYDNDDIQFRNTYGALYNWYAVNTEKLCPSGWHVPSFDEWTILETFLGGSIIAGGKMKETATDLWQSPNTGATNESGFNGVPGGYRGDQGLYIDTEIAGIYWTSNWADTEKAFYRALSSNVTDLIHGTNILSYGASVRCIKN